MNMKWMLAMVMMMGMTTGQAQEPTQEPTRAILAGGCFWCLQHDLEGKDGIVSTHVGYAGGDRPSPVYETYHDVDATYKVPHIEVVEVVYDPAKMSFKQLLELYVRNIDPTDGEGQFCDRGPGYRPAIFVKDAAERVVAEVVLADAAREIGQAVDVDILPDARFWPGEDYHQHYATKNPTRYKYYRWSCGRDARVKKVWG